MHAESIADTAYWVAYYRAVETERPDALFHDPYARLLAGARGEQFAASMHNPFVCGIIAQRTVVFDELVLRAINDDTVDLVLNLAAGLDTRPYRLHVPARLRWVEIDLPDTLAYKQRVLKKEQPACHVESLGLDLSHADVRRQLLAHINSEAKQALVLSEGLLLYLPPDEVANLARDLHAQPHFSYWLTDVMSPTSLHMMAASVGERFEATDAPLRFAPEQGADFFQPYGWNMTERRPAFAEMRRLKRLPPVTAAVATLLGAAPSRDARSIDGTILLTRLPTPEEEAL
jgi:methyltransferase (TIGR00027 family)